MLSLSNEQWRQLNLPLRLEMALKNRLGLSAAVAPATVATTSAAVAVPVDGSGSSRGAVTPPGVSSAPTRKLHLIQAARFWNFPCSISKVH